MNHLFHVGNDIVHRHTLSLQQEHVNKTYYKVLLPHGKLTGKPLVQDGPKYTENRAHCVPMRRLTMEEKQKMSHPKKYEDAYRSIVHPCPGDCRRQYCGYCCLRKHGVVVPSSPREAQRFLIQAMSDNKWNVFRQEKNMAPTKLVCKLLSKNHDYMDLLHEPVHALAPVPVPLYENQEKKRRVFPLFATVVPVPLALPLVSTACVVVPKKDSMAWWWWFFMVVIFMLLVWRRVSREYGRR